MYHGAVNTGTVRKCALPRTDWHFICHLRKSECALIRCRATWQKQIMKGEEYAEYRANSRKFS